jgi:hypothetical protein
MHCSCSPAPEIVTNDDFGEQSDPATGLPPGVPGSGTVILDWRSGSRYGSKMYDAERRTVGRLAVAHIDPAKIAIVQTLSERYPPESGAPYSVHSVIRTGRAELDEWVRGGRVPGLEWHLRVRDHVPEPTGGCVRRAKTDSGFGGSRTRKTADAVHRKRLKTYSGFG